MKKPDYTHHIGWVLFGGIVLAIIYYLSKLKTTATATPSSVTHQPIFLWDSRTDPVPSFTEAPPFQNPDGSLMCSQGYSLYQDKATGNYACYRDPNINITQPSSPTDAVNQVIAAASQDSNPFRGAQLTDEAGNPIPGGT